MLEKDRTLTQFLRLRSYQSEQTLSFINKKKTAETPTLLRTGMHSTPLKSGHLSGHMISLRVDCFTAVLALIAIAQMRSLKKWFYKSDLITAS